MGAPGHTGRGRSGPASGFAWTTEPGGYHSGLAPAIRAGAPVRVPPRRRPSASRSRVALPARRPARPVGGRSTRRLRLDRRRRGPASRARARSSTRCTSARSRRRAPGAPPPRSCRSWRGAGITVLEVMPVADFPGGFGWGYDGVDLFAPTRLYGRPDDFRPFVDRAHALGLGVILDVVYNHLGPDGNYLGAVRRRLLHATATRPSGARRSTSTAPDAGAGARVLRRQRRLLDRRVPPRRPAPRRDAERSSTTSPEHILAAIGARGARRRGRRRSIFVVAENEPQDARLRPRRRARAATASTRSGTTTSTTARMVALTGRAEAYYTRLPRARRRSSSRRSSAATSTRASATPGRSKRRGTPALGPRRRRASSPSSRTTTRSPTRRAACACHAADQPRPVPGDDGAAAARARARRCCSRGRSSPRRARSSTSPTTTPELARAGAARARASSWRSSRAWPRPETQAALPDPADRRRSSAASSTSAERERHAEAVRAAPRPAAAAAGGPGVPRAAAPAASTARCSARRRSCCASSARPMRDDRLLLRQPRARPAPARRAPSRCWRRRRERALEHCVWSSEAAAYGGGGHAARSTRADGWRIPPGRAAVVLAADVLRMTDLDPPHSPGRRRPTTRERSSTREWLVTNGLGGYASGTRRRRRDAPLPRPARSPRCPAPLGRMMMLNHLGERLRPAGRRRRGHDRGLGRRSEPASPHELRDLAEFRLEAGLPVWRYEVGRRRAREARAACRTGRTRSTSRYRLVDGAGAGAARRCGRPSTSARTSGRSSEPAAPARTALTRRGRPLRARRAARSSRALRLRAARPGRRRSASTGHTIQQVLYRVEESRGYEAHGRPLEPGLLPRRRSSRSGTVHAGRLDRAVGGRRRARARDRAARPSSERRGGCSPPRHPAARTGPAAELVAGRRPVRRSRPAGRVADAARARAAGRRGAHGHRRLPLVHRLGPRHDDQPRGADAR